MFQLWRQFLRNVQLVFCIANISGPSSSSSKIPSYFLRASSRITNKYPIIKIFLYLPQPECLCPLFITGSTKITQESIWLPYLGHASTGRSSTCYRWGCLLLDTVSICDNSLWFYLTVGMSSLEQVPETGRWRFMNTSPESEAKVCVEINSLFVTPACWPHNVYSSVKCFVAGCGKN